LRPTFVVLNQTRPQGDRTDQAREFVAAKKYPVCPVSFGFRVAFEDADTLGRTPQETEPLGLAAREIAAVYAFTDKLLSQLPTKDAAHAEEKEPSRRAG
jgi:chromosome partitioning protein